MMLKMNKIVLQRHSGKKITNMRSFSMNKDFREQLKGVFVKKKMRKSLNELVVRNNWIRAADWSTPPNQSNFSKSPKMARNLDANLNQNSLIKIFMKIMKENCIVNKAWNSVEINLKKHNLFAFFRIKHVQ